MQTAAGAPSGRAIYDSRESYDNAFLALMLVSLVGHALTGWHVDTREREQHGHDVLGNLRAGNALEPKGRSGRHHTRSAGRRTARSARATRRRCRAAGADQPADRECEQTEHGDRRPPALRRRRARDARDRDELRRAVDRPRHRAVARRRAELRYLSSTSSPWVSITSPGR